MTATSTSTLDTQFDTWMTHIEAVRSPRTLKTYRSIVSQFISWCRDRGIADVTRITPVILQSYVDISTHRLRPSSLRTVVNTLRQFIGYTRATAGVDAMTAAKIQLPRMAKREAIWLDRRTLKLYLEDVAAYRDPARAVLTLLPLLGTRISEIIGVAVSDVRERDGTYYVLVHGKNSKERNVPLSGPAREELKRYTAKNNVLGRPKSSALFPGVSAERIRDRLTSIGKRIGVPGLHPHSLRHTFATNMSLAGYDLKTIQELMGHEDIKTTALYVHTSMEQKARAVEGVLDGDRRP